MAGSKECAVCNLRVVSTGKLRIRTLMNARNLIDQFVIWHLVLGAGRFVRAKKHAYDVAPVSFSHTLLDEPPGEITDSVQPGAKSAVLARGQVPDIFEQWSWDVPPGRLENEVVPRRV
jgi:hypothetical protein